MDADRLQQKLTQLEGRSYKAYREIKGAYRFSRFTLFIDHVQSDPYAAPSRFRARVSQKEALFGRELYGTPVRKVALEDYLARSFAAAIKRHVKGHRGTGKSGFVGIDAGGQEIIERTAAVVTDEFVEARFVAGLPAAGRRCLGREAVEVLLVEVPRLVKASLYLRAHDSAAIAAHVEAAEDQQWLREELPGMGLVAFVAEGSLLPRQSGISDLPLSGGNVIAFKSPDELRVQADLPNRGRVAGMGMPEGVTLIVGGGYHGKSTLLKALERGVYNHLPGDGRDGVLTRSDAVKIRAEDGRRVEKVNIDPFISNLPFGIDTTVFSTENASGSTSQAANIIEALEAGARLLLIDEDTSATNFMVRDGMMQQLVSRDREPITPFIDQVENLYREHGVSTILVMGGSGDYFSVADTVIAMHDYLPEVVTARAREIAAAGGSRLREGERGFGKITHRVPLPRSIDPRRGGREKVAARGLDKIEFGRQTVDLASVEQLVDASQTRAIGEMVRHALKRGYIDGGATLSEAIDRLLEDVAENGLDSISPYIDMGEEAGSAGGAPEGGGPEGGAPEGGEHPGEYALPRRYEIAAMLNRMRSLKVDG